MGHDMATTKSTSGPGKTEFVTEILQRDPNATIGSINEAWTAAGHEGSIGTTLFYSTKSSLKGGGSAAGASTEDKAKTAPAARTRAKSAKSANRAAKAKAVRTRGRAKAAPKTEPTVSASTKPAPKAAAPRSAPKAAAKTDKGSVIDKVESEIDDAIFSLKNQGGFPEVEAALRAARRILSRSHGH